MDGKKNRQKIFLEKFFFRSEIFFVHFPDGGVGSLDPMGGWHFTKEGGALMMGGHLRPDGGAFCQRGGASVGEGGSLFWTPKKIFYGPQKIEKCCLWTTPEICSPGLIPT